MEKRNITFITGNVATYDLTPISLTVLLSFLPNSVDYGKVTDTLCHVESLEALEEVYNNNLVFTEEGGNVSEIFFFDGECFTAPLSDYELRIKLDRVEQQFCYSEIAKDVYKVSEIKYLD